LIRKDNEFLHREVVLPALRLLHEQDFEGANEEYLAAHEHYRHARYKDCLKHCFKAFESAMKAICAKREWTYNENDAAKSLIDTCLKKVYCRLSWRPTLALSVRRSKVPSPPCGTKLGGHGQGAKLKEVPAFYATFLLHETATTIVFLIEAYKNLS
jgi:hypothetical protein